MFACYNLIGDTMNGAFFIDKESGCTSRDVVNEIIKKVETTKVGHTGTLDPMATGVLIICVGKATKLVDKLTCHNKEYEAEITLGIKTDSLDITGNILEEQAVTKSKEEIVSTLNKFVGEYEQTVPIYSAVKVKGKKLYQYARANENVELPKRNVKIEKIELIDDIVYKENKTIFKIRTTVSKGTYIRALVSDIATSLNTIGVMSTLRRTKLGNVNISDCKSIDDLSIKDMVKVGQLLKDYPTIKVNDMLKKDILNGKIIEDVYHEDEVLFVDEEGLVLALYKKYDKDNTKMKPDVMLGGI